MNGRINSRINRGRETGIALLALIFIILALGLVAYTFVNILSSHRIAGPGTASTMKAFYLKEGALEIGQQYVADYWATGTTVPLGENVAIFPDEPLGDGHFSLWVTMTDIRVADFEISATVPE